MTQPKTDPVVDRCVGELNQLKQRRANLRHRRDEHAAAVIGADGRSREWAARSVADKDVTLAAYDRQIAVAEANLAHARDDLPRRDRERAEAAKRDAAVGELAAERAALLERVSALTEAIRAESAAAARHRARAGKTQNELALLENYPDRRARFEELVEKNAQKALTAAAAVAA